MKKTAVALFAAIALVLGSGALASGASAAYPVKVATKVSVPRIGSTTEGKNFVVRVRVKAGNASVSSGTAKIVIGGKTYRLRVVSGIARIKVKAPQVSKTRLKGLKVYYTPAADSVFQSSSSSSKVKVKNRK